MNVKNKKENNTKENLKWIFEEDRKTVTDYPDFEPLAPSDDDIADELSIMGTYL